MEARTMAADSFNADLKLLRHMTAHQPDKNWPKPKNMAQLATLLKYKNSPSQFRSEQVEKGRSWLRKKGIDIETIYNKIQRRTELSALEQARENQQDSYFYVNLTPSSVPQYLEKSYEYGSMNLLQHVMGRAGTRRKFISRAVEAIVEDVNNKRFKISWAGERVAEQREAYLKAVKNVVRKDKDRVQMLRELLNQLKTGFYEYKDQSIWEILAYQLDKYAHSGDTPQNMTAMFIGSLKLVQSQFQKRLHGQDVDRYLAVTYLHRIYGKSHEQKERVWSKSWLYMMAGMHRQALELVSHRYKNYTEFANNYLKSYESINVGKPVACRLQPRSDIKDVFYDQMIFCLNADSRYSNQLLCENHSLQLVWLVLRTTAIFYGQPEKAQKLQKLRESIVSSYKDCTSNPQLIRNMLYLLDYESIAKLGPNILLNQDDYLHFVIVMSAFPELVNQVEIEKLLIERLIEAIIELMVEKREEYVYYIALLPQWAVAPKLSSIIVSSDAIDSINWQQLKELLPEGIYNQLAKATVASYVSVREDYLKAAEKITELVNDPMLALDYLTSMMVKYHLRSQMFNQDQVVRAEEMGLRLGHEQSATFERIFELFANSRRLNALLMGRDENKLQEFIASNELIFLDNRAICGFIGVLERLSDFGGVEVYFNFLRDAVKATEICSMRARRVEELRSFKALLLDTCQRLLESPQLSPSASQGSVAELLQYLRQGY